MREPRIVILIASIYLLAIMLPLSAQNYYVSNSGNDSDPGSFGAPFKRIQKGMDLLDAGDTLFIRGGSYHEEVIIDQKNGTESNPIVITSYNDEEVILDGTIPITTAWTVHAGNIYKTSISEDIWQLFVGNRMQVIARWPNATTHPVDPFQRQAGSWKAVDGTWWSKETTWANADAPATENGILENNDSYHDLAATGKDFTGGSVLLCVLEQGGDGNQERPILGHQAGSSVFNHPVLYPPKPSKAYRETGKYYLIEHLDALDQEEEWYYIDSTNTVYLWPKNGVHPSSLSIRGRNISRSIEITNSSHVKIRGLDFFASNFSSSGDYITIEDCSFLYPDASKRLLGIYPETSSAASEAFSNYSSGLAFSLINCTIEYTEYSALRVINGDNSIIHNNLFRHLAMLGLGKNGAIEQVNTYTRNTFIVAGNRGAVKTNTDPASGRNQSFNYFEGFGFLQVSDGASLQAATNKTPGTIRSYNWFTYALKYGSRWDGNPAGVKGVNHHQVGLMVKGTIQSKGDDHSTYNNSSFYSQAQNDIIILSDPSYGGNQLSRTYNNLADKISGHRSASVADFPLPGSHSHNWNGYNEAGNAAQQVYDIDNYDFRPRPGSDLVDAGKIIPGFTDGYIGSAPDIGAYEFGDTTYWIPGYQAEIASRPIPMNNGSTSYEFVDLMWLKAYRSDASHVYFGNSALAVEKADTQSPEYKGKHSNNIFNPGQLSAGVTYYWRVDAVVGDEIRKGETWSFTAGADANPDVFTLEIELYGKDHEGAYPLGDCEILVNERRGLSDDQGKAEFVMLTEGKYYLQLQKENYLPGLDSVWISSDTTIVDTLTYHNEDFRIEALILDQNTGDPVNMALLTCNEKAVISASDGAAVVDGLSAGTCLLRIEHSDYFEEFDTIELVSDTLLQFWLTPLKANVTFRVSDQDGPLASTAVSFGSYETSTFPTGEAYLFGLPAREEYNYRIEMDGYESIIDTLWLELDTTLTFILLPPEGIPDQSKILQNLPYPNPADNTVWLPIENDGTVKLISLDGRILTIKEVFADQNSLDISGIPDGSYIIQYENRGAIQQWKLMVKRNEHELF